MVGALQCLFPREPTTALWVAAAESCGWTKPNVSTGSSGPPRRHASPGSGRHPAELPIAWDDSTRSVWRLACNCGGEQGRVLGYPLGDYKGWPGAANIF